MFSSKCADLQNVDVCKRKGKCLFLSPTMKSYSPCMINHPNHMFTEHMGMGQKEEKNREVKRISIMRHKRTMLIWKKYRKR